MAANNSLHVYTHAGSGSSYRQFDSDSEGSQLEDELSRFNKIGTKTCILWNGLHVVDLLFPILLRAKIVFLSAAPSLISHAG